jgi:uncharacterized membrane protein
MDGFVVPLTVFSAVACGLMGGAFYAFSSFVMQALGRLPSDQGMAAMKSINVVAITPAFMAALFLPALSSVVLAVVSILRWGDPGIGYVLAGSVVYIVGVVLLTGLYHVPRNDALAAADPHSAEGTNLWRRYLSEWTTMNHVRSAAGLASAALFAVALHVG